MKVQRSSDRRTSARHSHDHATRGCYAFNDDNGDRNCPRVIFGAGLIRNLNKELERYLVEQRRLSIVPRYLLNVDSFESYASATSGQVSWFGTL
ncbi:hypothetical protein RvY_10909 [Ramazzottius varieornatus]|uniref:Uncharacterized protein n=1 Tax=Ramazzottius varieornatus TaxID=947166 RepID=A0A1D1VGD0_RAMVA|nr:hypothetical protein RvY_10909 [Ramazzottius varieornatus]